MIVEINQLMASSPYVAYSYAYPHKSAYRSLEPSITLQDAWSDEPQDALFLYLHVPFCEYRCGFCNLFTTANSGKELTTSYLSQLQREAAVVRRSLPNAKFARLAIGGGTPTFLDDKELEILLNIAATFAGTRDIPTSCECSPATTTPEKLRLLRQWGVERLSLGVQTFNDDESRQLGRPQRAIEARRAIEMARQAGFPVLNIDLIFGIPGQTIASWMQSVDEAIRLSPEELYLYPLYVRELTGLGTIAALPNDLRLESYRIARQLLVEAGYEQVSLRMYRRGAASPDCGPVYCCQSDGMVGLGCGARSYTRGLHYSTEFAVGRAGVRSILLDYISRDEASFARATHGYKLDEEDQRRRFLILCLLQSHGLSVREYSLRFGSHPCDDFPQLWQLVELDWALDDSDYFYLTETGIERSDAIGPWLYSHRVRALMEEYECR